MSRADQSRLDAMLSEAFAKFPSARQAARWYGRHAAKAMREGKAMEACAAATLAARAAYRACPGLKEGE